MPAEITGRVLVTTPSFGQFSPEPAELANRLGLTLVHPRAEHPLTATQIVDEAQGFDAVIVGLDDVSAVAVGGLTSVRVIAKHGVGTDNIDVAAAGDRGITVVNAPGSNAGAVADLTLGLVLATTRAIVPAHTSLLAGEWGRFSGRELSGSTLGLVGFGRIGQAVALRAQAFGTRVVAYDPYLPDSAFSGAGVERLDLDELLAAADIVSLHMPGGSGEPLLDRRRLSLLPEGAVLINAARGGLVDETCAAEFLVSGRLSAAAFDAFSVEPPVGNPLLTAPNVILTPHIGAYTDRANAAMGVSVVEDIARVLRGGNPEHPVIATGAVA